MQRFKRFVTYENLKQYTKALKEWLKKKIPKKAADISSDDQGYTTGEQVYDYVQSNKGEVNTIETISINGSTQTITNKNVDIAVPDVWDFQVSYYPNRPSMVFSDVKKNGEVFNGNLSTYAIKITNGETVNMIAVSANSQFINGSYTAPLNISQVAFLNGADTIVIKIGAPNGYVVYEASYTIVRKAQSVADGEVGFVTGSQVYDYVNNASSLAGAMHFRGSVTSSQDLPASPVSGDVYVSTGTFTHNNEAIEPGDIFIYTNVGWAVIQGNIDTVALESMIPTNVSELNNDEGYISMDDIESVSDSDINNLFNT